MASNSGNSAGGVSWASVGDKIGPLAQRVSKGFTQAVQWSEEKLGTAVDLTELPSDYLELEKKVDTISHLHQQLIKVTKNYSAIYGETALPDSFQNFTKTFASTFQTATSGLGARDPNATAAAPQPTEHAEPKTVYNAFAKTAFEGAAVLGTEDSFGTVLMKFGSVEDKIGDNKAQMNHQIQNKVITPLSSTLNTTIQISMKARKNVTSLRLELDALRSRHKNVKPERAAQARKEIDDAEEALVLAVDKASELMRLVIDSPEPLRNIAELVAAQMDFYKEAYELLADIAPEIDEIQVTHESLYRQRQSN
ncbi:BAR domain-containing protein [Entomophthora muscae]|uniref:BAR domain-containing protein n=1 Tax=Entomophthora muscae TaxID=34485 RepID=A0ACC2T6B6_9FUNG|nr:BAR domain-containing protein [Entomophthora muscae]